MEVCAYRLELFADSSGLEHRLLGQVPHLHTGRSQPQEYQEEGIEIIGCGNESHLHGSQVLTFAHLASRASPSKFSSTPAIIFISVLFPAPFAPSTPIFAPGKKDRDTSLKTGREPSPLPHVLDMR